jgi:drug/metabolite transporter (DMT)-like permease
MDGKLILAVVPKAATTHWRTDSAASREAAADSVPGVVVVLALMSSLLWGIADFSGGTASRRLPAIMVVLASQAIGLVPPAVAALAIGAWSAPAGYLPWAAAAGLTGMLGLLLFYRAMAIGTIGVVSPIAALSVVIPVAAGLATGHWPSAVAGAGIVLAVIGVVAASGPERAQGRSIRPVALAVVAAACFGTALLFIARGAEYSPLLTMVGMRVASVLPLGALVLVLRSRGGLVAVAPGPRAGWRTWALVAVAGVFDVSANLTFAVASTGGSLAVVAVLGSLYPAVTVVLAGLVHGERLARLQQAGVVLALAGVALIAGWS